MSNNPICFRVPKEYREAFEKERKRQNITPGELSQRLVIRSLTSDSSQNLRSDFVFKNTAFITQVLAEILDKLAPEDKDEILEQCKESTMQLISNLNEAQK